jgi:hypothetical protein
VFAVTIGSVDERKRERDLSWYQLFLDAKSNKRADFHGHGLL